MRFHQLASAILLPLLLAGCATTNDPKQAGFVSGLANVMSGGYEKRVEQQGEELARLQEKKAKAEAEANETRRQLAAQQTDLQTLRTKIADLDQSMARVEAQLAKGRDQNATLTQAQKRQQAELADAGRRLKALKAQAQTATEKEAAALQAEHGALMAKITMLADQLSGS